MEECGLCGIVCAIWKFVVCVEECKLCGKVWAMWNRLGYNE